LPRRHFSCLFYAPMGVAFSLYSYL